MDVLVGFSGFVGSNLALKHNFDLKVNSKNITESFETNPDLCVYSGIRAEKFLADKNPIADKNHIDAAIDNIVKINPKKLVLISTVDVISASKDLSIYEDTSYPTDTLTPYGENRLFLEHQVRKLFPETLIVRLPALFGPGIKKNFIYDLIHFLPQLLNQPKFIELNNKNSILSDFYTLQETGFYKLKSDLTIKDTELLKSVFQSLNFSALNFTDSRAKFSFYNLEFLWNHIEILLENNIKVAHMAVEPILASELYQEIFETDFCNEISANPFDYSFFKTNHANLLNNNQDYIFPKSKVISDIKNFIEKG